MKQRPILVAAIGYIIGIWWGLYFKFSIILLYTIMIPIYYILRKQFKSYQKYKFKLITVKRYSRYLKLIIHFKAIFILVICSVISNSIVLFQNNRYESSYQDGENIQIMGIIVSEKIEKQYNNVYQIKVLNSKHFNLLIQISKKSKELEYGDKVKLQGEYKKPFEQKNYGGYNDKQYLKTLKISGRVKVKEIEIVAKKQLNVVLQFTNHVNLKIKERLQAIFTKEKAAILKGLLLGETEEIPEEVKENFQTSNISHILAVSGMHISYIIIGLQLLLKKQVGKTRTRMATIVILILYALITGGNPSIIRSVVMSIITIGSGMVHRKSDIWNSIAVSLLSILLYNPFLILDIGLQLSYLGTIGIVLFRPVIVKILNSIQSKKKAIEKVKEVLAVSLSAQIMIFFVVLYHFNIVGIYFLITNLLVSIIIGPILILAFFTIFISFVFNPLTRFFCFLLNIGLEFLSFVSNFSQLPLSKIYFPTPNIMVSLLYFVGILVGRKIYFIYHSDYLTATQKRVKNLMALFRYQLRKNKKKCLKLIFFIFIVLEILCLFPKDLKVYFVDVGQGDCTFIITPKNKTILIDGGGSKKDEFDVGKKTLIPYLLDRGYTTIDYIMISHFDQDHVRFYLIFIKRNKSKKYHNRKTI